MPSKLVRDGVLVAKRRDSLTDEVRERATNRRWWVPLVGLMSGVLIVGTVSLPAIAGPAARDLSSRPMSTLPPRGVKHGSASSIADAFAQARLSKKRVEITAKRGPSTTFYANPNGTMTRVLTASPIRAKNAAGDYVAIDQTLTRQGSRLAPKVSGSKVSFRTTAASVSKAAVSAADATDSPTPDPTATAASGSTTDVADLDLPGAADVSLGYGAALPAPTVDGDTATYAITPTSSLQATSLNDGFSADVVLDAAPATAPTYSFPLAVAGGLTPRLKNGVIQFLDKDGTEVALSRPLEMWDSHRDAAGDPDHTTPVDSQLVQTDSGWTLQMTPSLSWLTDAATQFPVTVDPTIVTTDDADTWYYNGNTTDEGAAYNLLVGQADSSHYYRSYLNWNTGPFTGKDVTNATMSLYQYEAGSCSPQVTKAFPTTTVSDPDASNVKITTDSAWAQASSFNTGGSGCSSSNGYVTMDVTKIIAGYTAGEVLQYGIELRASVEANATYSKRFCSRNPAPSGTGHCEGTSGIPQLSVTYVYDLGTQPHGGTLLSHRLNDRSQYSVNTADGDGVYRSTDVHLGGRGLDLSIDRFFNSESTLDSQFGPGWDMSVGADVRLKRDGSNDRWDYISPSGLWYGRLVRKTTSGDTNTFWTPNFGGLNADMKDNGDGTFTMTFHSSQEKYTFSNLGDTAGDMLLTKDTDRNGNAITYGYDSTSKQLTSITDTHGRQLTVHHTAAGYIDSITESGSYAPTPRVWTYHYNGSNQLDYYIDPTGARTDYTYTGTQLASITDPAQSNGTRPKTTITVSSGQVTGVAYSSDAAGGVKQYTYSYNSDYNRAAEITCFPDIVWDRYTEVKDVSDPQNTVTDYCFKDRTHQPNPTSPNATDGTAENMRVVDGNAHHRSSTFTPDLAAQNSTSQGNDGVTGGSTVYTYNTNNSLQQATAPKDASGSSTAGTTSFDYANSSSVAGGSFLPSSTATNGSSCSAMTYDAKGNLTDSYVGQAATSGSSTCSGKTGGRHSHVDYNSDGTPKDAYGPATAALSTITGADETVYSYYTTEPNAGELKQVVRPGGNSTCTTDRTGCTSYTYDGYSRVATTTDGNGNTTTYSYDKDDRITQVLTAGATSCTPSAGTCIKYTYDREGNLTSRVDRLGTTTFTFDWLNNPTTQTQPDGTVLATTFDGAGNLTKYTQTLPGQSADSVAYSYDAANQLTSVIDAVGTFSYTYNNDGRPTKLTLPGSTGSIAYAYTGSGKVKSITPSNTALPSYAYDYSSTGTDTQTLRKTTNRDNSTITYAYDSADRIKTADASSGTDYAYTYDANSNLRSATAGSTTTYYGYNENNQLCWSGSADSASAAMGQNCATTPSSDSTYTSDKAGNNLGTSNGPLHYNAQSQVDQLSSPTGAGPVAQTYFDQGNNLRSKAGGDTFTDGSKLGITARTNASGTTFYTRDAYGQLLDEHGASGTYSYLSDRLGSVTALIDATGGLAGAYTYDPYGKTTVTSGSSTTAAQNSNWRYTGAYQDPTDGYYKLGARYYDTASHFIQADSIAGNIARVEQYNSYTYTAGDPLNNTDLTGQSSLASALAGGSIALVTAIIATALCLVSGIALCIAISVILGFVGGAAGAGATSAIDGHSPGVVLHDALIGGVVGAVLGGIGAGAGKVLAAVVRNAD